MTPDDYAVDNASTTGGQADHPCWSFIELRMKHSFDGDPHDPRCDDCGAEWEGP